MLKNKMLYINIIKNIFGQLLFLIAVQKYLKCDCLSVLILYVIIINPFYFCNLHM